MAAEYDKNDAFIKLETGESGQVVATRHNTSLFSFIGELSMYNHIFVVTEDCETTSKGMYVFNQNPNYARIARYMVDNTYPMHLHLTDVAPCDVEAFERVIATDVGEFDTIPADWK